ncbi:transposase [Alienimonas californiensis]|uniref:Transposase IS200 like protein n=1 Tax=Alienimonas californiensis TaxID=2527989 RepID=A0A517PF50_9PLAN|nr:transposase [Alienimonas californiensis]QDT17992.1 Transposase IS200 like protein [Alienimonas californiensis]
MFGFDRVWLLTWTTYGSRLPGDERGFVGRVRERRPEDVPGRRRVHNRPQTEIDAAKPSLERVAQRRMTHPPTRLHAECVRPLLNQFAETAGVRGWRCLAAAVMADHVHLLIGVNGDPAPDAILRDFKAYGSRALNRRLGARRWWSDGGSTRRKTTSEAVLAAARYVRDQPLPLGVRLAAEVAEAVDVWERANPVTDTEG